MAVANAPHLLQRGEDPVSEVCVRALSTSVQSWRNSSTVPDHEVGACKFHGGSYYGDADGLIERQ